MDRAFFPPWRPIAGLASVVAAAIAGAFVTAAAGCAGEPEAPPGFEMHVEWLTGEPTSTLPDDVQSIRIVREIDGTRIDYTGTYRTSTGELGRSFAMTDDGRLYFTEDILSDLPTGTPITVTVEGYRAGDQLAYYGRVGPIVLSAGQRYFADLKMYELGTSVPTVLENTPAVFFHTATALPDGRVLVAGGFDTVENGATCPDGLAPMSRCFRLTATRDAWIFEPTTGKFHSVRGGGMLAPRAGHTATLLPGGRVLVAGGASEAIFALVPFGSGSYAPYLMPADDMGESTAHASFEIFLPEANAEESDVDGDGDPGRGGFTGSSSESEPGLLNAPRFGHAAAATTTTDDNRVLLVGGLASPTTYEVYDDRKPGGPGVYDGGGSLTAPREAPGAVALATGEVWIVGGGIATSDADVAEVWTPSPSDPNGTIAAATESGFPGTMTTRPELALWMPSTATVGGGSHALVVGWLGARCAAGTTTPTFASMPDGSGTELCGPTGGAPRSFTVNGATGEATGVTLNAPHALAGIATLDDGSVAVTGGIANLQWSRQQSIELFTGEVSGNAAPLSSVRYMLRAQRALHSTTAIPALGLLTVGGINLSTDADNLTLQAAAEVLYLPRGPLPTN